MTSFGAAGRELAQARFTVAARAPSLVRLHRADLPADEREIVEERTQAGAVREQYVSLTVDAGTGQAGTEDATTEDAGTGDSGTGDSGTEAGLAADRPLHALLPRARRLLAAVRREGAHVVSSQLSVARDIYAPALTGGFHLDADWCRLLADARGELDVDESYLDTPPTPHAGAAPAGDDVLLALSALLTAADRPLGAGQLASSLGAAQADDPQVVRALNQLAQQAQVVRVLVTRDDGGLVRVVWRPVVERT